jgi:hypothetical protein
MTKKGPKKEESPIDKAIKFRSRGIERMRERQKRILALAHDDVARIEKDIEKKQILLDAIKRGALQP